MAFTVRVTGPEFTSEENGRAFLRIEESARQYSAHSREPVYLVRQPLEIPEDHFVLAWPRGIALVGMYPHGGIIRGREHGAWESEFPTSPSAPRHITIRPRLEHPIATFANPYATLERARKELTILLRGDSLEHPPLGTSIATGNATNESPARNATPTPSTDTDIPIALIALFTGPVEQMRIAPIMNALFSAMTIEDAVSRSMVHTPNLLQVSDIPGVTYSNDEIERIANLLEHSASTHEQERTQLVAMESAATVPSPSRPYGKRFRLTATWLVPILIVVALVVFFAIRSALLPSPPPPAPAPAPIIQRPPSEIVIQLPVEAELFISNYEFQTRQQLDRALTYGEGQRFLPDTEQLVVMDSASLAKGVYGYFKVENSWRKGKLLQTLQPIDTITVVKFLDALP